ncbi:MAG: TrmH family RNA methyltransferase [Ornithinimicrobium sp.]|uniref:TrmH family RNA methyltransferase n=1 Tax=Ornithinimicrobium sp. TaxID=1977084 RepID=UPI003D9BCDE3
MSADPPLLDNPRSDRVGSIRALGRRAARDRHDRFLVEGPQGVRELLRHAGHRAEAVYLTPEAAARHTEMEELARAAGVHLQRSTEQVLAEMADTSHPQGVLAVATRMHVTAEQVLADLGPDDFVVVLANVRDPGNAGTVIRGADAFGAAAVLVSTASVDINNPKVVRSSVGSLFHLPISTGTPLSELLSICRDAGLRLLAADGAGDTALPAVDLSGPHAWVLGNEAWGLERTTLALCDEVVSVPIVRAESLNLAMAATVCLHASSAARHNG